MPTTTRRSLMLLGMLVITLGACTSAGADSPRPTLPEPAETAPSASRPPSAHPEPGAPGATIDRPWATAELIDVATGQPFRIADLVAAGTVVFVEPMAIWCTNCRAQQADAMTALARLDRSRVVWIGLDVDPSETAEALAAYGPRWGFDHTYAVAGTDVARALVEDFGDLVISPPSTPIVVIGTDGTVTLTDYGHKSVDELVALARSHGA